MACGGDSCVPLRMNSVGTWWGGRGKLIANLKTGLSSKVIHKIWWSDRWAYNV
jgi:hypothetical protein